MKKQDFEDKIERAAAKFEEKVEAAADRFDKSVNHAAKTKAGKIVLLILKILIAVALIVGGFILLNFGHTVWAIVCFAAAGADVVWQIVETVIFRD